MAQFHMDRLQQDGFMPVSFAGATHSVAHGHVPHVVHADPEQEAVDAYDRPHFLPHEAPEAEYHELSDGGSDATVFTPCAASTVACPAPLAAAAVACPARCAP